MTNPSIPLRLLALSLLLSVLPVLRAQTDPYTAYIERYKTLAVQQMYKYGIPASITLSQGLLESGAGKSLLAAKANNHFGIKAGPSWTGPVMLKDDDAVGEKFRVYPNVLASYEDHSLFLSRGRRYASLFALERDDYKGWAHGLKSAGYATNPRYAHLLIGLIERYGLHRYDHFSRHAASALVSNESSAAPSALVSVATSVSMSWPFPATPTPPLANGPANPSAVCAVTTKCRAAPLSLLATSSIWKRKGKKPPVC